MNNIFKNEEVISCAVNVFNNELIGINKLFDSIDDIFVKTIKVLLKCTGKVVILGVGKSGHIGKKIAASMASTGTPAFFVHADEALHGDLGMIENKDIVIALSNSGETKEVINCFPSLKKIGCKIISITSNSNSKIAINSHIHICIGKLKEADHLNLAPSTSSTVTLILGDVIALTLSYFKDFTEKDFAKYHPGGNLGKNLTGKEL